LLDEVRLASQNRKLLVAVNSMNRLNPKSLDDEGMQWFGHDEAAARYLNIAQFFQAGARQNKDALACLNQLPYCFWIAMIAMMVRHQQYIEVRRDLRCRNRGRLDLFIVVQGKIC